ncbi:MAG: hypothetical protein U0800_05935 [Isosphaeraceae bacterium]
MSDPTEPSGAEAGPILARLRAVFRRLAAWWATPQIGRVAICSPIVGVIAGLGAAGFLLALQATTSALLGGLLGFQTPPTGEGKRMRSRTRPLVAGVVAADGRRGLIWACSSSRSPEARARSTR